MRALFIGQPYSESSVWSRIQIDALRQLVDHVSVFDERLSYLPGLRQLPPRISRGLKRRSATLQRADIAAMNRALVATAQRVRPAWVMSSKALAVTPDSVKQIKQIGAVTANWFPDDLQHFDWLQQAVKVYDYLFSFDSYTVAALQAQDAHNVYYLPLACDPAVHRSVTLTPAERQRYECDVAFVGAPYPERIEALCALREFDLKIWGYDGWLKSDLADCYQGVIDNDEPLVRLYNACRIVVNIHFGSAAHGANYRVFEASGCGAFQLVSFRQDIPNLFEIGQEIVTFDKPEDLRDKVAYYLDHLDERMAIARASQARAYREHTVVQRVRQMQQICLGATA